MAAHALFCDSLGRIRPTFIKRIAREVRAKYNDQFTGDFYKNREFLVSVLDISNQKLLNKVAGYVTCLVTRKEIL